MPERTTSRYSISHTPPRRWPTRAAASSCWTASSTPRASPSPETARKPRGPRAIPLENAMNAPDLQKPSQKPPLTDVKALRESARRHVEEGAVTEHYRADRQKVLNLLNEALPTAII